MAKPDRFAPAFIRRAFFILALVASGVSAAPPANQQPPDLAQVNLPDAAETRRIIEQFQQAGLAGNYYLEFELRVLPRRGDEKLLQGKLWGGRNEQGAILRIALRDEAGREKRFLLQNGSRAAAWSFAEGRIAQLGVSALFEPLVPGVEIAPFELQMPFLYWPDFKLEKLVRLAGRPTHAFFFRPPAAFAAQYPLIAGVRAYFDTQFNAPVQTELIGRDGRGQKTLSLVDLKRIGDQTLVKTIDVRNEVTRDKTRLQVTGVALNMDFAPTLFEPATLADEVRPPAAERITRLTP